MPNQICGSDQATRFGGLSSQGTDQPPVKPAQDAGPEVANIGSGVVHIVASAQARSKNEGPATKD